MPVPQQGLAAQVVAAGHVQPDQTSCGSAVLVMARAIADPAYAAYLVHGPVNGPVNATANGRSGWFENRFRTETLAMHRRTNRLLDARGRLQLPWPQALGTLPVSVARQLTSDTGTTYVARLVLRHQRAGAFDRISAAVAAGRPVPVFVGNRFSARHVVLAIGTAPHGLMVYDPARGRNSPITRDDFVHARLGLAGWRVPWFVVVPR
jgi:hypothetical protein